MRRQIVSELLHLDGTRARHQGREVDALGVAQSDDELGQALRHHHVVGLAFALTPAAGAQARRRQRAHLAPVTA